MADAQFRGAVQVSARWATVRGHAYGLRGPVILGSMRWPLDARWNTDATAALLVEEGRLKEPQAQRCLAAGLDMHSFLAIVAALEEVAQTPVTQAGVSLEQRENEEDWVVHTLAVPTHWPAVTCTLIGWLAGVLNLTHGTLMPERQGASLRELHARLHETRAWLHEQQKGAGINVARIERACGELGLPVVELPRGALQVGSGRNARMFRSTLTEATPAVAVALARSKSTTAAILAAQGMPVPRHKSVASADEAVAAAREFGYPVVVKPDDQDGGRGVYAGLTTEEQVRKSFALAAEVSRNILLEKHIEGDDFRITVDDGTVVKAIGRRPGGVTGDGRSTVAQLVDAAIAQARGKRGVGSVVRLDDEAAEMLAERGMSAQTVPVEGGFVTLRRRANMSTGGTSRDVLAELHPDNARLAIRAAQALRLDLAGIDLIIPDVAVSWMDGNSAICEVNAQPQISTEFAPDVYHSLLRRMVREPVRLRTVLVLDASGGSAGDAAVIAAAEALAQEGESVLSVRSDGRWLDGQRIAPAPRDAFAAARGAELETQASAAVAALTPADVLRNGVPWLHIDELRVVGTPVAAESTALRGALALAAPHVAGGLRLDRIGVAAA